MLDGRSPQRHVLLDTFGRRGVHRVDVRSRDEIAPSARGGEALRGLDTLDHGADVVIGAEHFRVNERVCERVVGDEGYFAA